jgi:hypothetical protein
MKVPGLKLSETMQRLYDYLDSVHVDRPKTPVPQKFLDELNQYGYIKSREEFLNVAKQSLTEEPDGDL